MTSGVGIVGGVSGVPATPAVSAPVSSGSASSGSFPAAVTSSTSVAVSAPFHNPIVVQDPKVGFITEYLSANGGQVVSQTPSAITVAYLRQGLSVDGTPKAPVSGFSVATTA